MSIQSTQEMIESRPPVAAPFKSIVCGVDGTAEALEATSQAGALAGPETHIELVAVTNEHGEGRLPAADSAADALEAARARLEHMRGSVAMTSATGDSAWQVLREASADHDLLVLGRHFSSRAEGLLHGSTVTHAAHEAHVPLLIAAAPPAGGPFPERIVVGVDGSRESAAAIRYAARICRFTQAEASFVRVGWDQPAHTRAIRAALDEFADATGAEPSQIPFGGSPSHEIVRFAERDEAALIIVGSSGKRGPGAVWSMSERIAHHAPCSVLVVRPPYSWR